MKISIESILEAKIAAEAIIDYLTKSLKAAGYLIKRPMEDSFYTDRRAVLEQLKCFVGK
jgi:hypothetical protein